jgi:peptidoglycan/xylan/chitin deacetylase (PgdA/CDA1 family)
MGPSLKKEHILFMLALICIVIVCTAYMISAQHYGLAAGAPIYEAPTGRNSVCLMINVDWGEEILPAMLEALDIQSVKATFFITGRFADNHQDIVRAIAYAGHEIANHGYSHPHVDRLSAQENQNEIKRTAQALKDCGIEGRMFYAPPYGEKKEHGRHAAQALGYEVIYWTLDTLDWK